MQKMHLMYNSIGKRATDFNGKFIEEDIQMTNNHIPPSALGTDLVIVRLPHHEGRGFDHLGYYCVLGQWLTDSQSCIPMDEKCCRQRNASSHIHDAH